MSVGFGMGGWIAVVVVIVLMTYLGYMFSGSRQKKNSTIDEYFLGNRSVGWLVLFLSFFAAQYSGNTIIGYPAQAYRVGYSYILFPFFMTLPVFGFSLIMPRLYVLAKKNRYVTASDYLIDRYQSHLLNGIAFVFLLWSVIVQLMEQLMSMGHLFEGFTNGAVPYIGGILILDIIVVIYVTLGGLKGTMFVQAIQGAIMFIGIIGLFIAALVSAGGLPPVAETLKTVAPQKLSAPPITMAMSFVSFAFLNIFGIYPHYLQQFFGTKDEKHLKAAISRLAFVPLFTPLLIVIIGIICAALFPNLKTMQAEQVMPMLMANLASKSVIYYWIVVIAFIACIVATLSSASAVVIVISSMLIKDIYMRYLNPKTTEERATHIGQISNFVILALASLIVLNPPATIWRLTEIKFDGLAQVGPALLIGLYWKKLSKTPTILGMICGGIVTIYLDWFGLKPFGLMAGVWGLFINIAIAVIGSLLFPDPEKEQQRVHNSFMSYFEKAANSSQTTN